MVSGRNRKMNVQRAIQAILHRQEPGEMAGDDLDFTSADQRTLSEHLKIAFLAMVVGALAGGAAILFRSVIDGVTFGAVGFQRDRAAQNVAVAEFDGVRQRGSRSHDCSE